MEKKKLTDLLVKNCCKGKHMAEVSNTNNRTRSVGETNYQNGMFQGKQFASTGEAVEAGAKAYAKLAWGEIKAFTEVLKEENWELPCDDSLAEMLVASKRKTIIASMEKREQMPKAFE